MIPLPPAFLSAPVAHRGYHDVAAGRPENSRAAVAAAAEAGYGIEIDVQLSADCEAMVFHDDTLDRVTGETGPVRERSAEELAAIPLLGNGEGIPTLEEIMTLAEGRAALLIEIKDRDGALGPDVGALERAVADAVATRAGPVAVMSFNPHSIRRFAAAAPDVPRGLTTCAFEAAAWPHLPRHRRERLSAIGDFVSHGASFVSHRAADLASPRIAELRAAGVPILCWTIRSAEEEREARLLADNITFEGYAPVLPAP